MRSKAEILRKNLHLPLHEIKKEIKKDYPEITNDDVEELIFKMHNINPQTVKYTQRKTDDDYER